MATRNIPRLGTGFTNLNRILGANAGNRLGQQVAQRVSDVGARAGTEMASAFRDFQTEAGKYDIDTKKDDKSSKEFAQDIIGKVMGRIPTVQATEQQAVVPEISDDELKRFQSIRQGIYQGPKSIENMDAIRAQAERAKQLGQFTTTQGGRQELLRQSINAPRYTTGQRKLDTLLLGQSPENIQQLATARQSVAGLGQQAQDIQRQAELYALGLQGKARQFGEGLSEELKASQTGIEEDIAKQVKSQEAEDIKRIGGLETIQRFLKGKEYDTSLKGQAGYTTETDAYGNEIVKDPSGNIVYKPSGGTKSTYEKLDQLTKMLKDQGMSDVTIKALVGQGDFAKSRAEYQKIIDDYNRKKNAAARFWASKDRDKPAIFREAGIQPVARYGEYEDYTPYIGHKESYEGQRLLNQARDAAKRQLDEQLYGKLGALGQVLSRGDLSESASIEPTLEKLGGLITNVAAPSMVTPTGAATEQQRQRYEKLSQLLGQPLDKRFSQIDPKTGEVYKYTPRQSWIDPEKIKQL